MPNIPIIGQPSTYGANAPNAPGLTTKCEVYDSEIAEIQKVLEILNQRTGKTIDLGGFDREVQDRFAAIGFKVDVTWYHSNVEGVKIPEITITDRIERKAFDHDQQVHEVTNDILGLGTGGVIKTEPGDFQKPKGHSH